MSDKAFHRRLVIVICIITLLIVVPIGCFLVWRFRLAHDVNTQLAAIRAAGLPTSGAELNEWYTAVPNPENAALVMNEAFALMRNYPDSRSNDLADFKIPPRGRPLTIEQRQLLGGYVEMNATALAKAHEATKLPKSRYPVDFSVGIAELPHLANLKKLAFVATCDSLLATESNRDGDADAAMINILTMARTLNEEPEAISQLVRMALLGWATDALQRRLNASDVSVAECAELGVFFSAAEKTNLIARALVGDRSQFLPYYRYFLMNAAETLPGDKGEGGLPPLPPLPGRPPIFFRITGYFTRDLLFYLKFMETNIVISGLPPPKSLRAAEGLKKEADEELEHHPHLMSAMFLPAVSKVLTREAQSLANLRLAETALAVERFRLETGRLPEDLTEITPRFLPKVPVDPFDGAQLKYRRLTKGYVVYSVGSDGHDDGGREKPADWTSIDKTSYDTTFTVER